LFLTSQRARALSVGPAAPIRRFALFLPNLTEDRVLQGLEGGIIALGLFPLRAISAQPNQPSGEYPFIEMNPLDTADVGLNACDLIQIHNEKGAGCFLQVQGTFGLITSRSTTQAVKAAARFFHANPRIQSNLCQKIADRLRFLNSFDSNVAQDGAGRKPSVLVLCALCDR